MLFSKPCLGVKKYIITKTFILKRMGLLARQYSFDVIDKLVCHHIELIAYLFPRTLHPFQLSSLSFF